MPSLLAAACRRRALPSFVVACLVSFGTLRASARADPGPVPQDAPGGFVEKANSTNVRALLTTAQIQALVPSRGPFVFPAPYLTQAARLTNATDCGGSDCVDYVGYSYWRNINNHAASNTMLIFLGLDRGRGGAGPTLFSYDKTTQAVQNLGPLFDAASPFSYASAEGWYWSATQPSTLYVFSDTRLFRYDVGTRTLKTVFDASTAFGPGTFIFQTHSSNDDTVHSATLKNASTYDEMGCIVYLESQARFLYYPKRGAFDECQVDASGRWLLIKENIDGLYGEDDRIIDLTTGVETDQLDQNGAAGHSDMGYGYMVYSDNWNNLPNAIRLWNFGSDPMQAPVVYNNTDWNVVAPDHISHTNARAGVAPSQQYACGSAVNRTNSPRANEIECWRLDTSLDVLVVAPVMTDLNAAGGGDDYGKMPKGNLDVTGQYFIWTANLGGGRLDAFVVRVPAQLLVAAPPPPVDVTPPVVALTSPLPGTTVSGPVTVAATATDDVGVAGVQFLLDGAPLGAEDAVAPYSVSWDTTGAANGPHALTATARDAVGHATTSVAVAVTVSNVAPATGPLGHWPLDEKRGTVALDVSGAGHNGLVVGNPARLAGVLSRAILFDGVDDAVTVQQVPEFDAYPLTVSAWFESTATGLTALVNKYAASSMNGYQLFLNGGSLCAWYFKDAADAVWDQSGCTLATPGFNDGRWHHVAFVVDAAGGRLYVDGSQTASRAWTGTAGPATTTQALSFGQYPGIANPRYRGLLDDVQVYGRALSASEIAALFAAGSRTTPSLSTLLPGGVTVAPK